MDYKYYLLLLLLPSTTFIYTNSFNNVKSCNKYDIFYIESQCNSFEQNIKNIQNTTKYQKSRTNKNIYILYDINSVEGFNLRRDVYIRLAVFIKKLRNHLGYENVKLVLPPFSRLYHWKSSNIQQSHVFWNHFFNLDDLRKYTSVLDSWEYFDELRMLSDSMKTVKIEHFFKLKNFKNMFDEHGRFLDKFEVEKSVNISVKRTCFGYGNFTVKQEHDVHYQGSVMKLYDLLEEYEITKMIKPVSILVDRAEVVLHDHWGDTEFWTARRSMRFSDYLVDVAKKYRDFRFGSNDIDDLVQRPNDWRTEKPFRKAIGGNYLCAHLRRADFLYGRESTTPTLRSAAEQIKVKLKELNIEKVFISSDCSKTEFRDLKSYMRRAKVYRFTPESEMQKEELKDGGIAIVDQIICSRAKYFIGTLESTFTYRIYEEREILGFRQETTFNTFCKHSGDDKNCQKNPVWPIVY